MRFICSPIFFESGAIEAVGFVGRKRWLMKKWVELGITQVAAHDALQAAAAALRHAVKSKGTAATIDAAKEVEEASLYIARLIGDPEAHRAALAEELAAENAALAAPALPPPKGEPPLQLDFAPPTPSKVCLLAPVIGKPEVANGPLLVYVPGLDGTGQGIRRQLETLTRAGYDVRALYIPAADRSTWQQLASTVVPLIDGLVATKVT